MAGDWQWSPLGMMCRHSLCMKSFLSGGRGPPSLRVRLEQIGYFQRVRGRILP